jgi:hypothetical protein
MFLLALWWDLDSLHEHLTNGGTQTRRIIRYCRSRYMLCSKEYTKKEDDDKHRYN